MILRAISAEQSSTGEEGKLRGTGTLTIDSGILGGILISTDSSNAAVIIVRRNDSSGKRVFELSTIAPAFLQAPISLEGTTTLYYDVSGTGADVQFYEWVP